MIYPQIHSCRDFERTYQSFVLHSNDLLLQYMDSFEILLEDRILDKYSTAYDKYWNKETLIQVILELNEAARVLNYHSNESIANNALWNLSDSFNETFRNMIMSYHICSLNDPSWFLERLAEKNLNFTNLDGSDYKMFVNQDTYPIAPLHVKRFFPNISKVKYWFDSVKPKLAGFAPNRE